jgi:hypothetical protein
VPSRIDVELTSARPDGTWTWRAAGAREPRGVVEATLLPTGAKVGDVFKVEATVALDGIEIHSVVPDRPGRKEPERLEILGGGDFQGVTTSLVGRRDRDDRGRRDRRSGERDDRRGPRPDGKRPTDGRGSDRGDERPAGDRPRSDHRRDERAGPGSENTRGAGGTRRPPRERRERPTFAPVPEVPQRPKPKRLKPGRAHRQELLAVLPESHRPIADQLFRGGLPSVRQALQDQNDALRAEGKAEIATTGIEALAQDLLPRVRVADWLDRADAALVVVDDLDLRDLRSVVTASADPVVSRDDTTRELSGRLREALDRRQNEEYDTWLADITLALDVGRVVRALRLSSRPPKAGVPFPPELGNRLTEAATAALTADAASDRWAAVIEALAFSPVHAVVTPTAPPNQVTDDLRAVVKGVGSAVPQIASLLEVEVAPPGRRTGRAPRLPRRPTSGKPRSTARPVPPPPSVAKAAPPSTPAAAAPASGNEAATPTEPPAAAPSAPAPTDEAPTATTDEAQATTDEPATTRDAPMATTDESATTDEPESSNEPAISDEPATADEPATSTDESPMATRDAPTASTDERAAAPSATASTPDASTATPDATAIPEQPEPDLSPIDDVEPVDIEEPLVAGVPAADIDPAPETEAEPSGPGPEADDA